MTNILDAWTLTKADFGEYLVDGPGEETVARLLILHDSEEANDRVAKVMAAGPQLLRELQRLVDAAEVGLPVDVSDAKRILAHCARNLVRTII